MLPEIKARKQRSELRRVVPSEILKQASFVAPTLGFAAAFALSVAELRDAVGSVAALLAVLAAAPLGILAADLASGVVHWLCDRFGDERTPWIGRAVIAPFREHHVDPEYLGRKDFFDASASNAWLALAVQAGWLWLAEAASGLLSVFAASFVLTLTAFVYLTNTFHQWAHQAAPPRIAHWLRRAHLAITPEHHARHHRSGNRAYCVTTGWCNPWLERARVFERIERWVAPLRSGGRSRASDA